MQLSSRSKPQLSRSSLNRRDQRLNPVYFFGVGDAAIFGEGEAAIFGEVEAGVP
jgi:hypothetical protein